MSHRVDASAVERVCVGNDSYKQLAYSRALGFYMRYEVYRGPSLQFVKFVLLRKPALNACRYNYADRRGNPGKLAYIGFSRLSA